MTAVDELRQAAAKVRDIAAKATPGPWSVRTYQRRNHPEVLAQVEFVTPAYVASVTTKRSWGLPDAQWKALMSPDKAEPLARLLDAAAQEIGMESYDCDEGCDSCGGHEWPVHNSGSGLWCEMPINLHGKPGDWCACPHIGWALTFARLINGGAS